MSLAIATLSPVEAYEELMRFAGKFGETALRLAFHAAVPQSFRTDLLHLIKVNFVPEAKDDYTVEADILLSPLCKDIGRGYFQFDPQVRLLLLDNLVKTYAAEKVPRLNRVANFILSYANHFNRTTSGSSDRLWKEYLETQRWVALAFINPESAATQFAECLQNSVDNKDIVTRLQLSGLAASLSAPLAAYSQLVNYASALQTAETSGHAEAAEKFGQFLEQEIVVGDIKLRPVSEIVGQTADSFTELKENLNRIEEIFESTSDSEDSDGLEEEKTISNNFFNIPDFSNTSLSANRKKLLEEIRNLFSSSTILTRGINIVGTAGLGKTHLAAEYARHYRNEYTNGVYWLDAQKNIEDQFSEIARLNNWTEVFSETPHETGIEKYGLFDLSGYLFIFDNVEKFEDIENYLPNADARADILITSREAIPEFYQIELKALEFDEARVVLLQFSNRTEPTGAENEHLRELVESIGGHPMSLINVGTFLSKNPHLSFGEFNELFNEISPEEINLYLPADNASEEDKISVRLLKTGEKIFTNKYPSNDLPEILTWSDISGVGFSLLSALVGTENVSNLQSVLNEAVDLHLVRKNEQTGRYAAHPLLFVTKADKNTLPDKTDWVEKIAERLFIWFDERAKVTTADLAEFENESDNLLAWQGNLGESDSAVSINLDLLSAKFSRSREKYEEAERSAQNSLKKYQSSSSTRNENILAAIYYELWMINFLKADYQKALEYILRQLEILQSLFEEYHIETVRCLDNVGQTFEMLGNLNTAMEYYQRALNIKRRISGSDTLEIANSLEHMSSIYIAHNQYEKALEYQQKALYILQELPERNDRRIAFSLSNLGECYYRLGDHQQALDFQRQSFEILSKVSESSEEIKTVENRLVLLLIRLGRFEEAQNVLLASIHENTATGQTYSLLGRVYKNRWEKATEDEKAALNFLDKAIDAYLQAFENYAENYAGINLVTLMELREPPDPRREKLLPEARREAEQFAANKTPDYRDYTMLLELAVLAKDKEQAFDYTAKALAEVREIREAETTVRNLRLIREAREKRGEDTEWIKEIERRLSYKTLL